MARPKGTPEFLRKLYDERHGQGAADKFISLPKQGYTIRQAAEELGVTFQRVSQQYQALTGKTWEEAKWESKLDKV